MPVFKLNKLVRDKIVDHQYDIGAIPTCRRLSPDELRRELIQKLTEEAAELEQAS
ncbi:hypothetical protein JNJ66_03895 [Candidatus Saccharibacteria bacterium]|nr:hypothetical protein [Candidatus Saccharibacteria bacterium]